MLQKIITACFYLLFLVTPLVFTPLNSELFEFNKMVFVYILTAIIVGTWMIKSLREGELIVKRTPLDIPIVLFLASQILSTIFSIDRHTSIFGYYSRSNGGLLSLISYILLFYALLSNFTKENAPKFLKAAIAGGVIVSVWAIPEHFGASPSCAILTGQWTDSCWVQDVKTRVFATLGQPNWLAAYLGMLLFPCVYFAITQKGKKAIAFYAIAVVNYLAFTFTNSRGALIGVCVGMAVLVLFNYKSYLKPFIKLVIIFALITLIFGSTLLGRFNQISQSQPPQKPGAAVSSGTTQLENGGTESGQIRLIVWRGALEIFKHYPILGSGVETFAYSYYNFRPVEHNLTTEWDFLYNKAHNEYLNYLATTGIVGLGTYLFLIGTFLVWALKKAGSFNKREEESTSQKLLLSAFVSSYISYLVQDIVQFSVVIIALFFYLFPGLAFLSLNGLGERHRVLPRFAVKFGPPLVFILTLYILFTLAKFWLADTFYAKGMSKLDGGDAAGSYNLLIGAVKLNPSEPLYHGELGSAAAEAAVGLEGSDATLSAQLKNRSVKETELALMISPTNVSLWRTAIRNYYSLTTMDPSFNQKTLDTLNHTIDLSPTDPKLYYNKALVLGQLGQNSEAINAFKKAISLKPDYRDAHFGLATFYEELSQKDLALAEYKICLQIDPHDSESADKIKALQSK